uniref:Protein kinase domain-containing protein n=1 Tax=Caenorhabditis tropicalis TaxID=1561998 RepID=A0A1I7V4W4_9PELO
MSDISQAFKQLEQNPIPEALESFTTQIETLSKMLSRDAMKTGLIGNIGRILKEQKFDRIRKDEAMLRLYKILIAYSDNLKGSGIFKELLKKGHFNNSLKFYLLWAEECGKEKLFDEFKKVLCLAREALSARTDMAVIEAGFRDLVDEYFNGESGDLFSSPDDTMSLFRTMNQGKKAKRRSSVCFLQQIAPKSQMEVPLFGPKTKTKIRREFVDSTTTHGISIEEYRFAQWKDACGEDVDNIARRDSGIVAPKYQPSQTDHTARDEVEKRMNANLNNPRRRHLSPLDECNGDDEEEKRSRIYSPAVPTKDAHRPPLRTSTLSTENIPTITLSSDTKSVSAKDASYDLHDDSGTENNDKLKFMNAGRGGGSSISRPERSSNYSTVSTSSCRTAKSGGGLDLMAENNHLEAHAMFSDTVHLGSNKTLATADDSIMTTGAPSLAPTQSMATDFSVLCDPDPTMALETQQDRPKKTSGLNMVYDEQATPEEEDEPVKNLAPVKVKEEMLPKKSIQTPPSFNFVEEEDEMFQNDFVNGLKKPHGMFVTSTPAHNVPFVNVDDYFGNKFDQRKQNDEEEEKKPTFAQRRKSQAPSAIAQAFPPPAPKPDLSKVVNSSIDCLSDNLGRRLSIGAEEIQNMIVDEAEITGCKNRRRSEVIQKGDINPWDETLRKKLMMLVRPALNMHEFQDRAPKLQALRDCEVGGETFHIQTLIGQGGYAKVYRAINEDKKTVAVKYEVPSCSWEVYICDQMRNRLIKDGGEDRIKMADMCIMQVIDAYVFSTASLLVNEYHEFGTLLEYANNMKDPNWHITCFLITQMARILKEVHACNIIHGDIKPDNFMITRKIDSNWGKNALMSSDSFVIKIIDWGRAIDMMPLKGQSFKGRAGTEGFDSPEMIDGRSWNYQADFYGFAATMAVVVSGKYAQLTGDKVGSYALNTDIKRRNVLRDTINGVVKSFLNIPSCDSLPEWSETIQQFSDFWNENFDVSAWRQAVVKFNEACDLACSVHK